MTFESKLLKEIVDNINFNNIYKHINKFVKVLIVFILVILYSLVRGQ